jgi:hypothetical protein
MARTMKMAMHTSWETKKGGSDWVGARAFSPGTLAKSWAIRTKTWMPIRLRTTCTKVKVVIPKIMKALRQRKCLNEWRERKIASATFGSKVADRTGKKRSLHRGGFAEREECGLGGRSGGDGVEFGVVLAERFGNFDFGAFEDVDELEGVDDGLALEMIVGDDEGVPGLSGDFVDAGDPRSQFFRGVEIVVALVGGNGRVVGEPRVVAAAMKTDVAEGRSDLRRRSERTADDGLVDVAEAGVVFTEERESFGGVPRVVADFDDERVIAKAEENGGEIRDGFPGAMKRKRELKKDGAEFIGGAENIEAGADGAFVVGGGAGVVGEFLPELGGEDEARIGGDKIDPVGGKIGAHGLVKGGINLNGVEEFGEIGGFVETLGATRRIHVASPVRIRPAGRADAQGARGRRRGVQRSVRVAGRRGNVSYAGGGWRFSCAARHGKGAADALRAE